MTTSLPARGTARTAMTHEKSPAGRLSLLNGTVPGSPPAAPARAGADRGGTGVSAAFHKKVAASDSQLAATLVRPTGFEPAAFRVGAERSIHLSYGRKYRCLFRRARGRGISFRLLCRRTLYPPAEGKNLLAKVHPSYGRKYRCLFGRAGRECRFCYLW